jgi:hypothetical protein
MLPALLTQPPYAQLTRNTRRPSLQTPSLAKQDDIRFLEASLTPERLHASMLPAFAKRRSEILAVTKLPVLEKNDAWGARSYWVV